ncbi:MAG TPA: hypothetical protein VH600_09440 [Burkholderiales bacterium]|jgi:hypothetical protein
MHCELIVPGLFAEASGTRAPALELLLARGRSALHSGSESLTVEAWLQAAFAVEGESLPAGALSFAGAGGAPGAECWARADPVHLRVLRDRLIVVPSAAFALARAEADALVEALNRHFGERLVLEALEAGRWCARLDRQLAFQAAAPLEAAGRDVDLAIRAGGEAGKRWAALLNEAQMLLHEHPVNAAREARGEPAVNSLWLWGAGSAPRVPASRWRSVSAGDPVALGLARVSGAQPHPLPEGAEAWLRDAPPDGRHLVLLDALRAPLALGQSAEYAECIDALEKRWFAPLLGALRAGRVGMVTVHVPDSLDASFETIRGDLRRFWRRPRALEKYA